MQRWTAALISWRLTWLLGTKLKESWWRWVSVADTCSSALRIVKSWQTQGIVAGVSKTWEWTICLLPGSWIHLYLPPYENVAEKSDRGRVVFEFLRLDINFPRGVAGHSRHEPSAPLEIWKKYEFHLNTQKQRCSNSTSFTSTWNTVGMLVRPNGMTKYSKCPMGYSVSVIMGNQGSEGCLERRR